MIRMDKYRDHTGNLFADNIYLLKMENKGYVIADVLKNYNLKKDDLKKIESTLNDMIEIAYKAYQNEED